MPFNSTAFWITYLVLQSFWVLGAIAAYSSGMLTVAQMKASGHPQGLPYLWHFGMWHDFFIVHLLCALLVGMFADEWFKSSVFVAVVLGLGLAVSMGLHIIWASGNAVESQMIHGKFMPAGFVHMMHAALIVAILASFVSITATKGVPVSVFVLTAGVLIMHLAMGTHWPLHFVEEDWVPREIIATTQGLWLSGLGAAVLIGVVIHTFVISSPRLM